VKIKTELLSISITLCLVGCATPRLNSQQLERVAKDWSLGVRASQIIPVYPMTEDLQPGDIFLVQTPLEQQVKVYLDKGFLPLENLVTRLPAKGYDAFYRGWPGVSDASDLSFPPRLWQFPRKGMGDEATGSDFARAPIAAFPSYSFSVDRSTGLSVAIPVQSVPIGLNLLDTASATGSITLKDAYTYALSGKDMYDGIQEWAAKNRTYLRQFAPQPSGGKGGERRSYLRVVNRVYLVKTVNVSLFANRGTGATASGGLPTPVELLNVANLQTAEATLNSVNQIISKATGSQNESHGTPPGAPPGGAPAVGGTVKLALATARSITLVETFARPLVIGYLAFDYPIRRDGSLDVPVATFAQLEGRPQSSGEAIPFGGCDEPCARIREWRGRSPENAQRLTDWLKQQRIDKRAYEVINDPNETALRRRIVEELIGE